MNSRNDMHLVYDAVPDSGKPLLPDGKFLRLFEKLREAKTDPCAKDFFDIGAWLLELGHEEAADKALELALEIDPDMKEARRLRRHVTIRDVSLTEAKLEFLKEKFGTAVHVERSSQITSGSGASTDYVARHVLRVQD
jgi:hypothetical protein